MKARKWRAVIFLLFAPGGFVRGSLRPERLFPRNPGPPRGTLTPHETIRLIRRYRIIRMNLPFLMPVAADAVNNSVLA
jgi:hypothetical protein